MAGSSISERTKSWWYLIEALAQQAGKLGLDHEPDARELAALGLGDVPPAGGES